MRVIGLAGWSGSGKTTLLTRLLPELIRRGISVSTMKHAHHEFDVDQPGKDSWRHRSAGATEVLVASANRWALMHELRGGAEPSAGELMKQMSPVDLLIIEGFKREKHDKIEIHRRETGKPLLYPHDPRIVAVLSDEPLPDCLLPVIDLDDAAKVADFIVAHCKLVRSVSEADR
ncbi:MAG TPA: molybdopterin-guanine dinucleotide biosynthesis protein B [Dongiaceae bacterium]|jgi:molybdopterin-guanine dinucleotide biosynthesis protein B|nr:molybdopterin-guanine dinucleotide biosynthesis protein B [Dongiaceae bacterium]